MQKFPINIMAKVLGMGNALVDILLRLDSDAVLERLEMPRGSMQLVDKHTAEKVMKATGHNGATKASGGSAANTIHGLANLGIKPASWVRLDVTNWATSLKTICSTKE